MNGTLCSKREFEPRRGDNRLHYAVPFRQSAVGEVSKEKLDSDSDEIVQSKNEAAALQDFSLLDGTSKVPTRRAVESLLPKPNQFFFACCVIAVMFGFEVLNHVGRFLRNEASTDSFVRPIVTTPQTQ